MNNVSDNPAITAFPASGPSPAPWSSGFLIMLSVFGCAFSLLAGMAPSIVWGSAVALGLMFWCFTSPVKGMTLTVALSVFVVRSTEEVTIFEVAYGALLLAVLLGWVFRRLATGQPFAPTRTDRLLVWFLTLCILSVIPAYFHGNSLIHWFRELTPFPFFLPYLLLVTSVRRTSEIRWLCLAFMVVCLATGLINILEYRSNVMNAQYMWELVAGRRPMGEPLFFTTLTITSILIAFEGYRGWRTMCFFGLVVFCTVALALTFSRGYWVAFFVAMGSAVILMPQPNRRKILIYTAWFTAIGSLCIAILLGPLLLDVITVLGERFETIFGATADLSFRNRMAESAAVLDLIMKNPIWGYGFGYYYAYYTLVPGFMPTWYVHNVYLYLWLKIGLIGLVTFLAWYISVIIHGYRAYRRVTDPFLRPLTLGITSVMIAMIPLSITSPQFIQRDSILFLVLGMGIIELAYHDRIAPRMLEGK